RYLVFRVFCFFSSRRRHTISKRDWSSDVCSSVLHVFIRQGARRIAFKVFAKARPKSRARLLIKGKFAPGQQLYFLHRVDAALGKIGRASCRESVYSKERSVTSDRSYTSTRRCY